MRVGAYFALIIIAGPAAAIPTGSKKALDPNQVICRSEPLVGSRLQSQRTCLTRAQWKQYNDDQRRVVDRIQDQRILLGDKAGS